MSERVIATITAWPVSTDDPVREVECKPDPDAPSVSEIVGLFKQCEGSLDFAFRELDEQADVPQCKLEEIGNRRSRVLNLLSRLED